jgi:hypothetical protein
MAAMKRILSIALLVINLAFFDLSASAQRTEAAADVRSAAASAGGCAIGTWQPVMPINTARSRSGLAFSPETGKFYLAGGEATGGNRNLPIEEYDPVGNAWTDRSNLLIGVSNSGAVAVGQYVYVAGGYSGTAGVATMQRFDVLANTVVTRTDMPGPNYAHGMTFLDGKIYVMGGSPSGAISNTNYIYNVAGNSWLIGAPLPTPVQYPAVTSDDSYVYVLGGNTTNLPTVQRYDPGLNTWASVTDMNAGRGGPAAFFDGLNIWAVGGGWTSYLTSTEYYDGAGWVAGPPLSVGARTGGAAFGNGLALKAGGWNGGYLDSAEILEIDCLPEIDVNPSTLSSEQEAGQVVSQTVTISNTGPVNLNWTAYEAASDTCASADLPWVSRDPPSGTTSPAGADLVSVSFNSTNLASGVYTGTLCIDSDDADEPQVAVSLTLTVPLHKLQLPLVIGND